VIYATWLKPGSPENENSHHLLLILMNLFFSSVERKMRNVE